MPLEIFNELYSDFMQRKSKFDAFHNQAINMPRANFSEITQTIRLLKSLASYMLLIDRDLLKEPIFFKDIYRMIFENYKDGNLPEEKNRNMDFESSFLNRNENFDFLYSDEGKMGRRFRHYMEYFSFFSFFKDVQDSNKKIIDIDALEELILLPDEATLDDFRNRILTLNINNNDFIRNIRGIKISENADYRPAYAITKYMYEINRQVTLFEISFLFGIVSDIQTEKEIILKGIELGRLLPENREEQIKFIFGNMGWKNNTDFYEYKQSQNPDFKFKVFVLFMNSLGLVTFDNSTSTLVLTDYSNKLMSEDIPIEVLDLQNLLSMIDDDLEDQNKLVDLILRKRTDTITKAIQNDGELVIKMNKRNIRNPIIKNGRRVRNRMIAELAKIKCNYLDEVTNSKTFEGKNGRNYVEAHHIIEFNGENGPDITDNLICLGPQNHSLIHHGSTNTIQDFYRTCQTRGVLTFDRFKGICEKYQCLTSEHVNILLAKGIISKTDSIELLNLIDQHGVNQDFLESINIPS